MIFTECRLWARPYIYVSLLCVLIFLTPVTSGCLQQGEVEISLDLEPLYFEVIGRGQNALIKDTTEIAIYDGETWQAYQDSLYPLAPFEEVDFSQAFVLLTAIPQETSGYDIDFISVDKADDTIEVQYVLNDPGEDCFEAAGRTVPFTAVLVRRAEGNVTFSQTRKDYSCAIRRRFR